MRFPGTSLWRNHGPCALARTADIPGASRRRNRIMTDQARGFAALFTSPDHLARSGMR